MATPPENLTTDAPPAASATERPDAAPARPPAPPKRANRRRGLPPRERDRLASILALLMCLAAASLPLLIDLQQPAVIHDAEARALATSRETWRWQLQTAVATEPWSLDHLVPWHNGQEQLDAPPGLTWLHLLSFSGLDPAHAQPTDLIYQARLVSVLFMLLAVAAVFWAGLSIGGLLPATLAGLFCAAMPPLLGYGRLASAEMPAMSLALLSIAAAVWAIRPLKLPPSLLRQALGWTLCGLSLGMAILTGGLLVLPTVAAPLLLILVIYPNRLSHMLGGVAATCIAGLVLTPWALHVHEQDVDVWRAWLEVLAPAYAQDLGTMSTLLGERIVLLLLMLLPWTAWVIGGLAQPFSSSSAGSRMRMLLGWIWFVPVAMLLLLIPGRGTLGELVLVMPAAAMLLGQLFRQFISLSQEGRHARVWRILCWPHVMVLLVASILLPLAAIMQDTLVQNGWIRPMLAPMHPAYWVGGGLALVMLVGLSARYVLRRYPGRVVVCWTLWSTVACTLLASPMAHGPMLQSSLPHEARALNRLVADQPFYFVAPSRVPASSRGPNAALLFYTGRTVPVAANVRMIELANPDAAVLFVLAPPGLNLGNDFELSQHLHEARVTLWKRRPGRSASRP